MRTVNRDMCACARARVCVCVCVACMYTHTHTHIMSINPRQFLYQLFGIASHRCVVWKLGSQTLMLVRDWQVTTDKYLTFWSILKVYWTTSVARWRSGIGSCQRRIQEFAKGGWYLPFPSSLLLLSLSPLPLLPLKLGPLKAATESGEGCKLPQWGKRICCTQKLSESHWWQ